MVIADVSLASRYPIYLDHSASTPPSDEVVEAMLPWLHEMHANPHSDHLHGQRAAAAVEHARAAVADLIGADPEDIIFTSGATEANNIALYGLLARSEGTRRLAVSDSEHKSVLEVAHFLSTQGVELTRVPVDARGVIAADALARCLALERAVEVGVMTFAHANNEIGTVQKLPELSDVIHQHGFLCHVDAAQSVGKIPLDVIHDGIDLLSVSSHKVYGPSGIGALYIAPDVVGGMTPLMHGGGQERGLRAGTIPPFLAVGFGVAAALAQRRMSDDARHLQSLALQFQMALKEHGVAFSLLGESSHRLPGHLSLWLPGVDASDLLSLLAPHLSASTGSACTSGELQASHVLRAIGMDSHCASEVVRITFGRASSSDDALDAAAILYRGIQQQLQRQ